LPAKRLSKIAHPTERELPQEFVFMGIGAHFSDTLPRSPMVQPWKLLVYLAADNTLYNDAQVSLHQITAATFFSDIETIVQIDGLSAQLSSRYRCHQGRKELIWEAPDGYTGDRSIRLTEFLRASITAPTEPKRIFLVLWGHGAGLDHVYFYDTPNRQNSAPIAAAPPTPPTTAAPTNASAAEPNPSIFTPHEVLNSGNANRYVSDVSLARILDNVAMSIGRKIDLLGLDACMMAMAEVLHEMRNSTEMVVASDEEIPSGSWPYAAVLGDLARFPGMDTSTLSTVIVTRFLEAYSTPDQATRVSLSTFNLAGCGPLASEITNLVKVLSPLVDDGIMRRKILRARDSSRTADEVTYIDLGAFCSELAESFGKNHPVHESAQSVLRVITGNPWLIYHRDFEENEAFAAYGAAIYFPEKLAPQATDLSNFAAQNNMAIDTSIPDGPLVDGKKFPPTSRKFPPTSRKFPPTSRKFPPTSRKFPGGSQQDSGPQIDGYEILWDHYIELQFNKVTGWSTLIEKLIAAGY
jgi:cysteine peptidase C11 family protein